MILYKGQYELVFSITQHLKPEFTEGMVWLLAFISKL